MKFKAAGGRQRGEGFGSPAIVVIGTMVAKRAAAFASADDRMCQSPYEGLPPEAVRWLGGS